MKIENQNSDLKLKIWFLSINEFSSIKSKANIISKVKYIMFRDVNGASVL